MKRYIVGAVLAALLMLAFAGTASARSWHLLWFDRGPWPIDYAISSNHAVNVVILSKHPVAVTFAGRTVPFRRTVWSPVLKTHLLRYSLTITVRHARWCQLVVAATKASLTSVAEGGEPTYHGFWEAYVYRWVR
jgi:hypothetical protein